MHESRANSELFNRLRPIAQDGCAYNRYLVAGHPDTPRDVLSQLGFDKSKDVRKHAAENPNTPLATLIKLAADLEWEVRLGVCENESTPVQLLELLAQDDNVDVRFGMAESARTPLYILKTLLKDENPYVVWRASRTLNTLRTPDDPFSACA